MVNEVRGEAFRAESLPPGRQAVMFTADWCGHCRRFLGHFRSIREAYLVDISDEEDPLWETYDIHVVPTVIVFEDGQPRERWQGVLAAHHVDEVRAALAQ